MFQHRTGWIAVAVTLVGALTAADVFPLLSVFLTETIGEPAAHTIGTALVLVGAVIAKFSQPAPPPKAE